MRNDRILAAALRKREKGRMNLEIGGARQCYHKQSAPPSNCGHTRVVIYDAFNSNIPASQNIIGTITTTSSRWAMRAGWKLFLIKDT